MIYRVAICDDEEAMLETVRNAVASAFRQLGHSVLTDCFANPEALLHNTSVFKYDAVFLDISMPEMDGVKVAQKLRETDAYISIIFVSNRAERVFDAQNADPVRFVRKAYLDMELPAAVAAMLKRKALTNVPKLLVRVGETEKYLKIYDIMYVESFNNKQSVVLPNYELNVYQSMSFFEQKLLAHGFIRIHRCYIVNIRFIFSLEQQSLRLDNGKELPISRLRVEECKRAFKKFVEENDEQ